MVMRSPLIVPLPMPREFYIRDFTSEASIKEFDALCEQAVEILHLPLARSNRLEDIEDYGPARDLQYAQVGIFICAHCHILLAIWDGKFTDDLGGTGQVVRFHHDDIMEGFTEHSAASQQMLVDVESDLGAALTGPAGDEEMLEWPAGGMTLAELLEDEIFLAMPRVPVHDDMSECGELVRRFSDPDAGASTGTSDDSGETRPFAGLRDLLSGADDRETND